MKKTILITGSSAGIGKATAKYFQDQGWNVAATMRTPDKEQDLVGIENLKIYQLDVTDEESIKKAIESTINDFGKIDVILNNAGYGLFGAFETATDEQIMNQFKTNVFGVMKITKNIIPYFKKQQAGLIINVTSIGGLVTFPLNSVYHAAKFAVEGFSESLNYELNPLNIQVKLVEPGGVSTDFAGRSLDITMNNEITDYNSLTEKIMNGFLNGSSGHSKPEDIAKVIYTAATDNKEQLRYLAGQDAVATYNLRRTVSQEEFYKGVKTRFGLN